MNKNLFHKTLFFGLMVFASASLQAQTIAGDTANSWLKISPSTRDVGMGQALEAVPDAFDEVDINPAGIGLIGGSDFSFSQNFWAQGLSLQHLVYSQKLENQNGFSFGADYVNFGSINFYTVTGSVITANGSYSPLGFNLYGGYGIKIAEGLRGGLTAHFIYDNIQQTMPDQTAAIDAGIFYQMPGIPLSLSAVLSNLGWNLDDSSLPVNFKTGWAYQIDFDGESGKKHFAQMNCLTLAADGDWSLVDPTDSSFGFGGEYWYKGLIALRAGYRFADYTNLAGLTGFSLGAGVRYKDWQLDYALTTIGDFGTSNQISLSLMLGEEKIPMPTAAVVPSPTSLVLAQATASPTPPAAASPVTTVVVMAPPTFKGNSDMWELYALGIKAYRAGKYGTAAKYFVDELGRSGGLAWQYAEGYAMLGVVYEYHSRNHGHLAKALHYYETSLRIDPENKIAKKYVRRLRRMRLR